MNALARRLGLQFPLIQAPMAGVQGHALAAAVSEAGALGSLPAAMLTLSSLRDELQAIRAQMKWMDRADCRPPNTSTSQGNAAFMPGDIVRPVRIRSGIRPNRTRLYVIFCNGL